MKKIIFTLALAVAATASAFAQINVGAGYLNNTAKSTLAGSSTTTAMNGFYAGADYNVNLVGGLGLDLGLYYGFLTGKASQSLIVTSAKSTTTEHYVAVPVMLNYGFDLGAAKLFVFAGPTADLGLAANVKTEIANQSQTSNLYGDNSSYGRFDVLIGGGVGVEFNDMVRLTVGYNYGLVDRYKSDNITLHNSLLNAGVAFMF